MKHNGQYFKKYSSVWPDEVMKQITMDWETVYRDCRIASLSILYSGHGLFSGYVVFEAIQDKEGENDGRKAD